MNNSHRILLGMALLILSGCNYYFPRQTGTPVIEDKSFSSLYEQIVKPKCHRCHQSAVGGFDTTSYETIVEWAVEPGEPDNSMMCAVLRDKMMPPKAPLSDDEIEAICGWIAEGALNDSQHGV